MADREGPAGAHHNHQFIERMADSALSRFMSRWLTPILLVGIGFLSRQAWTELNRKVDEVVKAQTTAALSQSRMEGVLSEGIVRDIKSVQKKNEEQDGRIEGHENRLQRLERTVGVP